MLNEEIKEMNVYQKLMMIQLELKVPKNLYNSFGKYNYRNAEGILEAVKPYLIKYGVIVVLEDTVVNQGINRLKTENGEKQMPNNYIRSTARFIDVKTGESIITSAMARECEHKGMSPDQCSGTASSYARKYCLNALFLLDDTKDSDTDEMRRIETNSYDNKRRQY